VTPPHARHATLPGSRVLTPPMAALCSGGSHVAAAADQDVDAVWEGGYTTATAEHDAVWRWGRRIGNHGRYHRQRGDGMENENPRQWRHWTEDGKP
jgi:hypothetical protein